MLINLQSKKVDTLVSPERTGSALFAILLLECTAYKFLREKFFLKLNRLGINVSVPLCVRNISSLYCLLNKKSVIVIKMLVKYIRTLFDTRETLL